MTNLEKEIIKKIDIQENLTQRDLSRMLNVSLGLINKTIRNLREKGFIDSGTNKVTNEALNLFSTNKPENAIILAAGSGLRMVPTGEEIPKALIKVKDEVLIERLINQLKESGIENITIVTGFKKEKMEYLIKKFGVKLVYNKNYLTMNNANSLSLVSKKISNTYIVPCDIYLKENIFTSKELGSWYGLVDKYKENSFFSYDERSKNINIDGLKNLEMTGISFINKKDSILLVNSLNNLSDKEKQDLYWENLLVNIIKNKSLLGNILPADIFFEINNYEDLRILDEQSINLNSSMTKLLEEIFGTSIDNITNISIMKTGMTNRSFKFDFNNETYIMRIPGFGTNKLIDRQNEKIVYEIVSKEGISDELVYISSDNGFKVTKFIENSRVCDVNNENDIKASMKILKEFHEKNLQVGHYFNVFEKIQYYEDLRENYDSDYIDYFQTKDEILSLQFVLDKLEITNTLCHIDSVSDNFLFNNDGIKLIDWEYAAMQDPHLDIAMFAIYSMMDKDQIDNLIDSYFEETPSNLIVGKIYYYIAMSGLLWSNWCEYKKIMGNDFGEYSVAQYRFAQEYYILAKNIFEKEGII